MRKVHNIISQQINIFRSCYTDTQPIYAVTYFLQVTVILLCSHTFLDSEKYWFKFSVIWPGTQLISFSFDQLGLTNLLMVSLLPSRVNILIYKFWVYFAITYSAVCFLGRPAIGQGLHFLVLWKTRFILCFFLQTSHKILHKWCSEQRNTK